MSERRGVYDSLVVLSSRSSTSGVTGVARLNGPEEIFLSERLGEAGVLCYRSNGTFEGAQGIFFSVMF